MGVMKTHRFKARADFGRPSATAIDDAWQCRATATAIEAARKVVGRAIPAGTPIGRLSDIEWNWLTAAVLFGWISTRAEQAVAEKIDSELAVRMTGLDPEPWDAGVVTSVLAELAEIPGIDWTLSLAQWPRDTMVGFLLAATRLIRKAEIARDLSNTGISKQSTGVLFTRETGAAPAEFDDPIGI
jgi:hypothetical protein